MSPFLTLPDMYLKDAFLMPIEVTNNDIYGQHFGEHKPARSTVQVAALLPGSLIEIEAVALGV